MGRQDLHRLGSHGRSVRVFVETFADAARQPLVRVQWRENGATKTESLPDSAAHRKRAKAFAEGVAERLALHGVARVKTMAMRELGERYVNAHPVPETWRPKSLKTFLARWKVIVAFATPDRRIDTITPDTVDDLRKAMREQDYAVNQIANHVQLLKAVLRFARSRKYILDNPIADYAMRLSRDERRAEVPEWTQDDCERIFAQLDPTSPRQWRTCVGVMLAATLGGRSHATLNLEIADVDLEARTVHWRSALDKLGRDRVQPLPKGAVEAFTIAAQWREQLGYTGRFIIPGTSPRRDAAGGEQPFTYQGLNQGLRAAAARAGVRWVPFRALHGFRRYVVNNILALTGNLTTSGRFVGDIDPRTLTRSYVRDRPEELRGVADKIRLPKLAKQMPRPKSQRNRNANGSGARKGAARPSNDTYQRATGRN